MPASIGALDGCELFALIRAGIWRDSPAKLWDACCATGQEPIAYLESVARITALEAAQLRARAYQLPLLEIDEAKLASAQRMLPPNFAEQLGIAVVSSDASSVILATPKPTPELARAVSRCLPRWAIAWGVASPLRTTTGSARQGRTWNQRTTLN
jgi:hypothetical protein